jgi:anti-sigma factor RsiW
MTCARIVRLFGPYWDDETTQAEREWVEAHLASCASCRQEYEGFTRSLELLGSMPRVEPAPDLVERVLARARRAAPAPDLVPSGGRPWIPVTAALALIVLAGTLTAPWLETRTESRRGPATGATAVRGPARIGSGVSLTDPGRVTSSGQPLAGVEPGPAAGAQLAAVPDTLFDHSEDVEFILDPVKLHRGRATVTRPPSGVQGEKAVISF